MIKWLKDLIAGDEILELKRQIFKLQSDLNKVIGLRDAAVKDVWHRDNILKETAAVETSTAIDAVRLSNLLRNKKTNILSRSERLDLITTLQKIAGSASSRASYLTTQAAIKNPQVGTPAQDDEK